MSDAKNVSTAKPKIGGAISVAPIGTPLPQNAIDELDGKFKNLGFVSEDGLNNSNSPSSDSIKAWGGATVLVTQSEKPDQFTYKLIEITNTDVLKVVYGSDNVSGDLKTGITVKANAKALDDNAIIIDMILKDGVLKRIVIPNAQISELGDIDYSDSDAVGYPITILAIPDESENTHYEYMQAVSKNKPEEKPPVEGDNKGE